MREIKNASAGSTVSGKNRLIIFRRIRYISAILSPDVFGMTVWLSDLNPQFSNPGHFISAAARWKAGFE